MTAQGFNYVAAAAVKTRPELDGIDCLDNAQYRISTRHAVGKFKQSRL